MEDEFFGAMNVTDSHVFFKLCYGVAQQWAVRPALGRPVLTKRIARFGPGCLSMSAARYINSIRQQSCDPVGRESPEPSRRHENGIVARPA